MKGSVLLLAIFATECYCDHSKGCDSSSDCGENGFCNEDGFHNWRWKGFCIVCPSSGRLYDECMKECKNDWACKNECQNSCPGNGEYIEFMYL